MNWKIYGLQKIYSIITGFIGFREIFVYMALFTRGNSNLTNTKKFRNVSYIYINPLQANKWRTKELNKLGDIVRRRFDILQNPKDCKSARKMICELNKGCGFGCQLHHVIYCFMSAFAFNRTLIVVEKGLVLTWPEEKIFRQLDDYVSLFRILVGHTRIKDGQVYFNHCQHAIMVMLVNLFHILVRNQLRVM